MDISNIKSDIKTEWDLVLPLLKDSLASDCDFLNTINTYLLENKGKQIRPLLSILAAKACGESNSLTISCAVVSEMIHTATLLHDDVADNAEKRRGKVTVQKLFSPAASVLTGDYWLSKALFLLTKQCDYKVLSFFTRAVEELSEGELFQMQKADNLDTTEDDYYNIISRKTSSLFIAAITSSVYSVGAGDHVISAMEKYAYHLGIAFQIRDDIFDYMPELNTGKVAGSDILEKKLTLPIIEALSVCSIQEKEEIIEYIRRSNDNEMLLSKIAKFIEKYDGLNLAQAKLKKHSVAAIECLTILKDSVYKEHLTHLAKYVGDRVV